LHSTIVIPEIDEWNNELDVVLFGCSNNSVKFAETIGAQVDLWLLSRDKALVPVTGSSLADIIESCLSSVT
jgi:hypothetical protein